MDVHSKFIHATMIDGNRNVVREDKIECSEESVECFPAGIPRNRVEAAMEACGIWTSLYDYLDKRCRKVKLVNPLKTKAIASARIKTDKIDSKIIAELLREDLIAESYVPPKEVRELRETVRQRQGLVKIRTSLKNRVHALLRKHNTKKPNTFKDLFTVRGRTWLKTLDNPQINTCLRLLDVIEDEVKQIWHESKNMEQFSHEINLLKTMPGIGNIAAIVIMTEIVDVKRFQTPETTMQLRRTSTKHPPIRRNRKKRKNNQTRKQTTQIGANPVSPNHSKTTRKTPTPILPTETKETPQRGSHSSRPENAIHQLAHANKQSTLHSRSPQYR